MLSSIGKRVHDGIAWRYERFHDRTVWRLAMLHRKKLRDTLFISVTGSTGKTTTKDLVAHILGRCRGRVHKSPGSANFAGELAQVILRVRRDDRYCVTELSATWPGYLDLPLELIRPTVAIVTNIGTDHLSVHGSQDAIAQEKGKLVRALPAEGIAVLNADDPRVLAMRSKCAGRVVTYGYSADAMLRGELIPSAWPDRHSLKATWEGESALVRTQLCGDHWGPTVLAALAAALALGVSLEAAASAIESMASFEGRMSPFEDDSGVTFIRDDWKAPIGSIAPALDFLKRARAPRKVAVFGTLSDYTGDSTAKYVQVAREALLIADCVVFAGARASSSLRAKRAADDPLYAFPSVQDASKFLAGYLRRGDLVLLKGSNRADHLKRLVLARTTGVECWRIDCRIQKFCNDCEFIHVASGADVSRSPASDDSTVRPGPKLDTPGSPFDATVVVGLGNPGERQASTPHNVGYRVIDALSHRTARQWKTVGPTALVNRAEIDGRRVCLVKPQAPMNECGSALRRLAEELGFGVGDCIVVHDDLDSPIGKVRTRMRGSDGGHRGVRSIIEAFHDDKFPRVKIGVGPPSEGMRAIDYVLRPLPSERLPDIERACLAAAERVLELVPKSPGAIRSARSDASDRPGAASRES